MKIKLQQQKSRPMQSYSHNQLNNKQVNPINQTKIVQNIISKGQPTNNLTQSYQQISPQSSQNIFKSPDLSSNSEFKTIQSNNTLRESYQQSKINDNKLKIQDLQSKIANQLLKSATQQKNLAQNTNNISSNKTQSIQQNTINKPNNINQLSSETQQLLQLLMSNKPQPSQDHQIQSSQGNFQSSGNQLNQTQPIQQKLTQQPQILTKLFNPNSLNKNQNQRNSNDPTQNSQTGSLMVDQFKNGVNPQFNQKSKIQNPLQSEINTQPIQLFNTIIQKGFFNKAQPNSNQQQQVVNLPALNDSNSKQQQQQQQLDDLDLVFGKQQYQNEAVYEGQMKNNIRHGKGKLVFKSGALYEGEWKNGKMEGYGTLYFANGSIAYAGNWKEDKLDGRGTLYNDEVQEIDGEFDYTDFNYLHDGWKKYEGNFKEDCKSGDGVLLLQNGEKIQGMFKNDELNGKAIFYSLTGAKIIGEWVNNKQVREY